jgi:hypothetical protein
MTEALFHLPNKVLAQLAFASALFNCVAFVSTLEAFGFYPSFFYAETLSIQRRIGPANMEVIHVGPFGVC